MSKEPKRGPPSVVIDNKRHFFGGGSVANIPVWRKNLFFSVSFEFYDLIQATLALVLVNMNMLDTMQMSNKANKAGQGVEMDE